MVAATVEQSGTSRACIICHSILKLLLVRLSDFLKIEHGVKTSMQYGLSIDEVPKHDRFAGSRYVSGKTQKIAPILPNVLLRGVHRDICPTIPR